MRVSNDGKFSFMAELVWIFYAKTHTDMNEWMRNLYSALLCIAVHPKHFTVMWGGVSPHWYDIIQLVSRENTFENIRFEFDKKVVVSQIVVWAYYARNLQDWYNVNKI